MRERLDGPWRLLAREMLFRILCRHRQGARPNILLHCMPRSGSTWVLNTVAAHPGLRYVGRPFMTALRSRWRGRIPDLGQTSGDETGHAFGHFIHFEGDELRRFEDFARRIVMARWHIYPTLRFRAPYFHRRTDRVIFQVHTICAMIEWFHERFPVNTAIILRHPIPNALSVMREPWAAEGADFLAHRWFVDTHLTGPQVDLGRRILAGGSELERQVLDWSLRMLVPIRAFERGGHEDWLLLTYEQMILEPEKTVRVISRTLDLPDVDAMMRQMKRPSATITPSTASRMNDSEYLLRRWRDRIGEDEERRV
ncbi:MAG: sulfotransferase, partial [Planctomycetota bacterium]|nr:sulfotransferase [Planctomycetota bacterium]